MGHDYVFSLWDVQICADGTRPIVLGRPSFFKKNCTFWDARTGQRIVSSLDKKQLSAALNYRGGRYDEVVKVVTAKEAAGDTFEFAVFLFGAMAQQRLGHTAEARKWLDKATADSSSRQEWEWKLQVAYDVLLRETRSLIRNKPPEPKK